MTTTATDNTTHTGQHPSITAVVPRRRWRWIAGLAATFLTLGTGLGVVFAVVSGGTGTAHADALCDQMRREHGPYWPCINVPTYTPQPTQNTPPPTGTSPGAPGNGPNAGGSPGPGPGTGNGTPIIPVPGYQAPGLPGQRPPAPPQQTRQQQAPPNTGQPAPPAQTGRPAPQPPQPRPSTPPAPRPTTPPAPAVVPGVPDVPDIGDTTTPDIPVWAWLLAGAAAIVGASRRTAAIPLAPLVPPLIGGLGALGRAAPRLFKGSPKSAPKPPRVPAPGDNPAPSTPGDPTPPSTPGDNPTPSTPPAPSTPGDTPTPSAPPPAPSTPGDDPAPSTPAPTPPATPPPAQPAPPATPPTAPPAPAQPTPPAPPAQPAPSQPAPTTPAAPTPPPAQPAPTPPAAPQPGSPSNPGSPSETPDPTAPGPQAPEPPEPGLDPRAPLRIEPAPMPFGPLPGAPTWAQRLLEIIAQALDDLDVPKPDTPDDKEATQPARDERNATDDGPGRWVHEKKPWSKRSRDFERENTDAPPDSAYELDVKGTKLGKVRFDDRVAGKNGEPDTYVDAKGAGREWMIDPKTGNPRRGTGLEKEVRDYVDRHKKAADQYNAKIEYRVSTPELKRAYEQEIRRRGAQDRMRVVIRPQRGVG